jgi:hypothetical protein
MKVVVNRAVGSCFALSSAGLSRLYELKGAIGQVRDAARSPEQSNWLYELPRNDKDLIQVVEELGSAAFGQNAELAIIEIPNNANWKISEAVGYEYIKIDDQIL